MTDSTHCKCTRWEMPRSRLWGVSFSEEQSEYFPDVWKPLLASVHSDYQYLTCGSSASLASVSLLWEKSCGVSTLSSSRKLVMSLATASTSLWKKRNNGRVSGTTVPTRAGMQISETNCLEGKSYGYRGWLTTCHTPSHSLNIRINQSFPTPCCKTPYHQCLR